MNGRLRSSGALLAWLQVALATALLAATLAFRPYSAAYFCRLQSALKGLVLWVFLWAAVLSLLPSRTSRVVCLSLTLSCVATAVPFCLLVWRMAARAFPHDPSRPSIARSYARSLALRRQVQTSAASKTMRMLTALRMQADEHHHPEHRLKHAADASRKGADKEAADRMSVAGLSAGLGSLFAEEMGSGLLEAAA